jgi:hypothetical protein
LLFPFLEVVDFLPFLPRLDDGRSLPVVEALFDFSAGRAVVDLLSAFLSSFCCAVGDFFFDEALVDVVVGMCS